LLVIYVDFQVFFYSVVIFLSHLRLRCHKECEKKLSPYCSTAYSKAFSSFMMDGGVANSGSGLAGSGVSRASDSSIANTFAPFQPQPPKQIDEHDDNGSSSSSSSKEWSSGATRMARVANKIVNTLNSVSTPKQSHKQLNLPSSQSPQPIQPSSSSPSSSAIQHQTVHYQLNQSQLMSPSRLNSNFESRSSSSCNSSGPNSPNNIKQQQQQATYHQYLIQQQQQQQLNNGALSPSYIVGRPSTTSRSAAATAVASAAAASSSCSSSSINKLHNNALIGSEFFPPLWHTQNQTGQTQTLNMQQQQQQQQQPNQHLQTTPILSMRKNMSSGDLVGTCLSAHDTENIRATSNGDSAIKKGPSTAQAATETSVNRAVISSKTSNNSNTNEELTGSGDAGVDSTEQGDHELNQSNVNLLFILLSRSSFLHISSSNYLINKLITLQQQQKSTRKTISSLT
jgi:hypothetical protein